MTNTKKNKLEKKIGVRKLRTRAMKKERENKESEKGDIAEIVAFQGGIKRRLPC